MTNILNSTMIEDEALFYKQRYEKLQTVLRDVMVCLVTAHRAHSLSAYEEQTEAVLNRITESLIYG